MKTDVMKVVNIVDGVLKFDYVQTDWKRCVVSGEFRPPEEFSVIVTNNPLNIPARTNCIGTNIPEDHYISLQRQTVSLMSSPAFKSMQNSLSKEMALYDNSMPAVDLIKYLQNLITLQGPTVRVCITQDGYYADSKFAHINRSEIDLVGKDIDDSPVYSIGHSSQNA